MLTERFTFLCTKEERRLIRHLAKCFQRSQGDAIRFLIREAIKTLSTTPDIDKRGKRIIHEITETNSDSMKEL